MIIMNLSQFSTCIYTFLPKAEKAVETIWSDRYSRTLRRFIMLIASYRPAAPMPPAKGVGRGTEYDIRGHGRSQEEHRRCDAPASEG